MGRLNLDHGSPFVIALERLHTEAMKDLFNFTKFSIISAIVDSIIIAAAMCILKEFILAIVLFISYVILYYILIRKIVKTVRLKEISGIIFDQDYLSYYPNQEEVFNVIIRLSKMVGLILGTKTFMWVFHVFNALLILAVSLTKFI